MSLLETYITKLNKREFVVLNLWQNDKNLKWFCNIRTRVGSKKKWDISLGEGKTPGTALKAAYRKIWPSKQMKKK